MNGADDSRAVGSITVRKGSSAGAVRFGAGNGGCDILRADLGVGWDRRPGALCWLLSASETMVVMIESVATVRMSCGKADERKKDERQHQHQAGKGKEGAHGASCRVKLSHPLDCLVLTYRQQEVDCAAGEDG